MCDRRITGIVETIKYNCDIGKFSWDNSGSILLVAIWEYNLKYLVIKSVVSKSEKTKKDTNYSTHTHAIRARSTPSKSTQQINILLQEEKTPQSTYLTCKIWCAFDLTEQQTEESIASVSLRIQSISSSLVMNPSSISMGLRRGGTRGENRTTMVRVILR